jgi:hypothetical protein
MTITGIQMRRLLFLRRRRRGMRGGVLVSGGGSQRDEGWRGGRCSPGVLAGKGMSARLVKPVQIEILDDEDCRAVITGDENTKKNGMINDRTY